MAKQGGRPRESSAKRTQQHQVPGAEAARTNGPVQRDRQRGRGSVAGLLDDRKGLLGRNPQLFTEGAQEPAVGLMKDHLGKIVRQVIEYEMQAREVLQRDAPTIIADKVWRAYGLLKYARSLTFEETMNLLSGVRLGVGLNQIPGLSVYTLNKLLIFTQAAHLAALEGRPSGDPELPTVRATPVTTPAMKS